MPLFGYSKRIQQIHSHGLLVLLGLAILSVIPTLFIYLFFIGHFGFLVGTLAFMVFCWIVLESVLYYIFKRFSYQTRQGNTRRKTNIAKVRSRYATRDSKN